MLLFFNYNNYHLVLYFLQSNIKSKIFCFCQYTPNANGTPSGKMTIDFSKLDEKLGEGVAEGIWMLIRDAVAQEMHGVTTTLSEVLKIVSPTSKTESRDSKLPDTAPSAEPSDVPIVNKRSSRCKGIKRGQTSQVKRTLLYEDKLPPGRPWLYYSAYDPIWTGKTCHMEELVTNAHCDGTRKTLHKLMPGKQINGDVLVLVCSMLTYGTFGIKDR
ncbi:hypothetical protein PIB30_081807 [Stylosanthes scabra]|uniref:Uncharacterized protein n=1 Tax=Stylosanthes scabra TaxID=79078 RepID=A0ABU6ZQK5_9FABA|nr:hypothetical protein [Stylosanthes scabra]